MFSPDSRYVAIGSDDGSLRLWDIRADKQTDKFQLEGQAVTCLDFNPKYCTIANGSSDRTLKCYDLETKE
jgi:WD40 repeat protein